MTNPGSQSTTVENNPSAERFGSGEEGQNLAATTASVGADYYPVAFHVRENERHAKPERVDSRIWDNGEQNTTSDLERAKS
jgi:hypothetical protein